MKGPKPNQSPPNDTSTEAEQGGGGKEPLNVTRVTSPPNNMNKSSSIQKRFSDLDNIRHKSTTSENKTVRDNVRNRRFGPHFAVYDPQTFGEAEEIFAERRHQPMISSPSCSDEGVSRNKNKIVNQPRQVLLCLRPFGTLFIDRLRNNQTRSTSDSRLKIHKSKIFTVFIKTKHFEKVDPIDLIEG